MLSRTRLHTCALKLSMLFDNKYQFEIQPETHLGVSCEAITDEALIERWKISLGDVNGFPEFLPRADVVQHLENDQVHAY